MKPAPFDYHRPLTLEEALDLLAAHAGDAKPLAGGQSLIPAMNFRLAFPAVLVDLNEIPGLAYIRAEAGCVRVGGMTRHQTIERSEVIAREVPLLHEAMPFIAHPAIRTRGTIGGSLAHADPAAELPAVMLALDARFGLRGQERTRQVPASEFFTGLFSTALEPGELLTEIEIPRAPAAEGRHGWAFEERSRRHGDFALMGVAASVAQDDGGKCTRARVAFLSAGDRPILSKSAAAALEGETPSAEVIRAAAEAAARDDIEPTSDIHASSRFRRQLAAVLARRALERACRMRSMA